MIKDKRMNEKNLYFLSRLYLYIFWMPAVVPKPEDWLAGVERRD